MPEKQQFPEIERVKHQASPDLEVEPALKLDDYIFKSCDNRYSETVITQS